MYSALIIAGGILSGCLIALSWLAGSDAPYVPTKLEVVAKVLKLITDKKNSKKPLLGKKFYELGSGDGRIVMEAATLGADSVGIEQSMLRVLYSKFFAWKKGLENTRFIHGDVFKQNYNDADIIFIYLLPKGVAKLEPILKKEMKKNAIVMTQTFHFKNWKPYKKINLETVGKKTRWDITGGGNFQLYKV